MVCTIKGIVYAIYQTGTTGSYGSYLWGEISVIITLYDCKFRAEIISIVSVILGMSFRYFVWGAVCVKINLKCSIYILH